MTSSAPVDPASVQSSTDGSKLGEQTCRIRDSSVTA